MAREVLVFALGDQRFALDASCIELVARKPRVTYTPFMPAHVAGVCAIRGNIVPAIDLARLWKLKHEGDCACVLVIADAQARAALLIDEVIEIRALESSANSVNERAPDHTVILNAGKLWDAIFMRAEV